jgi:signal transduction histidine kinase
MSLKPKTVDTFFEVFGRRESLIAGGDFGLRPALSRRILRIFGGDAVVRTLEPKGFEIAVTLPVNVEELVHVS